MLKIPPMKWFLTGSDLLGLMGGFVMVVGDTQGWESNTNTLLFLVNTHPVL